MRDTDPTSREPIQLVRSHLVQGTDRQGSRSSGNPVRGASGRLQLDGTGRRANWKCLLVWGASRSRQHRHCDIAQKWASARYCSDHVGSILIQGSRRYVRTYVLVASLQVHIGESRHCGQSIDEVSSELRRPRVADRCRLTVCPPSPAVGALSGVECLRAAKCHCLARLGQPRVIRARSETEVFVQGSES
jgi:hypothetical protein